MLPYCAIDFAPKRSSGKHGGRIRCRLHLHGGHLRYGELPEKLRGITPRMAWVKRLVKGRICRLPPACC